MHKCTAWSAQVNWLIVQSSAKYEDLSSVIGRLENIRIVFRIGAHFLNNFQALELKASEKKHAVQIPSRMKEDAKLLLEFICIAGEGIHI